MDLKDNGKDISSTACKGDDSESHDEKHDPNLAENFAKAVLMWLDDLIDDVRSFPLSLSSLYNTGLCRSFSEIGVFKNFFLFFSILARLLQG